ncbi:hypothetical protein MJO28_014483, partial [Puccinia striiformis f. sp. tritici]
NLSGKFNQEWEILLLCKKFRLETLPAETIFAGLRHQVGLEGLNSLNDLHEIKKCAVEVDTVCVNGSQASQMLLRSSIHSCGQTNPLINYSDCSQPGRAWRKQDLPMLSMPSPSPKSGSQTGWTCISSFAQFCFSRWDSPKKKLISDVVYMLEDARKRNGRKPLLSS